MRLRVRVTDVTTGLGIAGRIVTVVEVLKDQVKVVDEFGRTCYLYWDEVIPCDGEEEIRPRELCSDSM